MLTGFAWKLIDKFPWNNKVFFLALSHVEILLTTETKVLLIKTEGDVYLGW